MLNLKKIKSDQKEIVLPFEAVLEPKDGHFLATCPFFSGCSARGKTRNEALKNLLEAVQHRLRMAPEPGFEVVWKDPAHPTWNALGVFSGHLVAGSNKDGILSTIQGDFGSWRLGFMTQDALRPGPPPRQADTAVKMDTDELPDFSIQIYCLSPFDQGKAPKLYAGTSADGTIYESVDGQSWDPAYRTGQDRVHCLATFKDRLYAGTSSPGKLFCFTGKHWTLAHRATESALTALAEFNGQFFMGTYPSGHLYASLDGVKWRLVHDSGQTFVRALAVFQGALYAATSKNTGGQILRSLDGEVWEKVFESKDPNYFCLEEFQHSLWLGTGNHGRVYRSQDGQSWIQAAALGDEGVRAMKGFQGRLYLAGEGQGAIYRSRFSENSPPKILDPRVTSISSRGAVVEWRTQNPSDSRVLCSTEDSEATEHWDPALTLEHRVPLTELRPLGIYKVQAISREGGISGESFSDELEFRTAPIATPQIRSFSHPHGDRWYSSNRVQFSWTTPDAVARFHYSLDRHTVGLPQPGAAGVTSTEDTGAQFEGLEDGEWWLHLRCEDKSGNLGDSSAHFRVGIDTKALPPAIESASHPVQGTWSNRTTAEFSWAPPEDFSGIKGYYCVLDQKPGTYPNSAVGAFTELGAFQAELGKDGDWYFHVTSLDQAGNLSRDASHFHMRLDRRADPPRISSPSHPDPMRWHRSGRAEFRWTEPQDLSGIKGYYAVFDRSPDTVPTAETGLFVAGTSMGIDAPQDGQWFFHLVTADEAGNVGVEASDMEVRIDTRALPPRIESSSHPRGHWSSKTHAKFELIPPDDLSGVSAYYYALDKEANTVPSPSGAATTTQRQIEFKGLTDGKWMLHVISEDRAGNVGSEAAHYPVWIDTQVSPPQFSKNLLAGQERWIRQRSVDLAWEAPEDLSGIAEYLVLIDAEPDTVPTEGLGHSVKQPRYTAVFDADGTWYFHVTCRDFAGNVSHQAAHLRVNVDTVAQAPQLSCPSHPDPKAWHQSLRVRFEWEEPVDASGINGYFWSFDRDPKAVPSANHGYPTTQRFVEVSRPLPQDGAWYFHLVSKDRAGNVGSEASHWSVQFDTEALPPLALGSTSHPDPNAWSADPNPQFQWTAAPDLSGVQGYYFLLDDKPSTIPAEGKGTWTTETRASIRGLKDGQWYFHVASQDKAGNRSVRAAHFGVRVDTQVLPPRQLVSPTHPLNQWIGEASAVFMWAPAEDMSGIAGYHYLLDQKPLTVPGPGNGQFSGAMMATVSGIKDGAWYFHVSCQDRAGNNSRQAAHLKIQVDTGAVPPRVFCSTHPDQDRGYPWDEPQFSWTPPAEPSGIAGYYYCVDQFSDTVPGPQCQWTTDGKASPGKYPDGGWIFHLSTKDGAGNISSTATHVRFRVDSSLASLGGRFSKVNGISPADSLNLELQKEGSIAAVAVTDRSGNFEFPGIQPGVYSLKASEQGLPPLFIEGVRVGKGGVRLSLSTELCPLQNFSSSPGEILFYVLAREAGSMSLKIYKESGTVVATIEAEIKAPLYQKVSWTPGPGESGNYLYQAVLNGGSGKVWKYPIRKIQVA